MKVNNVQPSGYIMSCMIKSEMEGIGNLILNWLTANFRKKTTCYELCHYRITDNVYDEIHRDFSSGDDSV